MSSHTIYKNEEGKNSILGRYESYLKSMDI